MSLDDPRITAFALNELPATERAEIERFLQTERAASDEVAQTQQVAGILRNALHAQPAEGLTSRHREAIFRAALAVNHATNVERKIINHPALWQRGGFWQAAAACMICGFGVYAITARLYGPAHSGQGNVAANTPSELSVQIGQVGRDIAEANADGPEIVIPANATTSERQELIAKIDAAKTQRIATSRPNTGEAIERGQAGLRDVRNLPNATASEVAAAAQDEDITAEIRKRASVGKKPASTNGARSLVTTQLTSARPAEPVVLSADLGKVTLTGEESASYFSTRDYLQTRWKEASSLHTGDSYETLARYFRHDGGISSGKSHRFVMIRCPLIKVDVEFAGGESQKTGLPPEARIEKISRPYFEPEAAD